MATNSTKLTPKSVHSAFSLIRPKVFRTPVIRISDILPHQWPIRRLPGFQRVLGGGIEQECGIHLFVKCENMQKSGSFKFRGALNALTQRSDEQLQKGILSYSTGNHAKALALASQIVSAERGYPIPITIVMSKNAVADKISAVKSAGVKVLQRGDSLEEARTEAQRIAEQHGLSMISPADDEDVMLGQGTVMLEFMEQVAEMDGGSLDAVVLPLGGGSLLAGSAIAAQGTSVEVFGSKPLEGGPNYARMLSTDTRSATLDSYTVADCLRCPVSPLNREIIRREGYVRDIYTTPENDIGKAMALLIDSTKLLIEPGSAVPLAVVFFHPEFRRRSKEGAKLWKVGVVLSGGNTTLKYAHDITRQCA